MTFSLRVAAVLGALAASYIFTMASTGCIHLGEITVCDPLTAREWAISMLPLLAVITIYELNHSAEVSR